MSESNSSAARRKDAAPESPSNFKLIENTIKSDVQKSLYKQFMHESKVENQGLKFDLMRAQEPSEASHSEMEADQDLQEDQPIAQPDGLQPATSSALEVDGKLGTITDVDPKDKSPAASQASQPNASKPSREPSATNITDSTVMNKFKLGVDRNEEEFK